MAALWLAACNNTTISGPVPDVGIYHLVGIGGVGLPAVAFEGEIPVEGGTATLRVMADSGFVTLFLDGEYQQQVWHTVTVDGAPEPVFSWVDHGFWASQGSGALSFVSGLYEGVAFPGTRSYTHLTLDQDLVGEGEVVPYEYRK